MKHRFTRSVVVACALAAAWHPAWAQPSSQPGLSPPPPSPLTLAAAIDLALRANPELRAAGSELAAQDGALAQAGVLPNPELELLREGASSENRSTTVQMNIPVELGGKRAARIDAAHHERQLAALARDAQRDRVRADTAAAFHELAAAGERERMAQELVALSGRALDVAARRVVAGKSSPVDETRARVAQGSARIDALQAARDAEGARIRLAALWQGDARTLRIVVPETAGAPPHPPPPLDQLLARLDGAPAMRHARAAVTHREALARLEKTRRVPDVNVVVGTQREGPDAHNRAVLGLSVPLPLFNRNDGAVLDALRRVDKARDLEQAEAARLRAELAQAHARATAAQDEIALIAGEILPGAEDAHRAATRGFEVGKFGLTDVLDAQRALAQAKNQYLNAVLDSHRAAADIARLLGSRENP